MWFLMDSLHIFAELDWISKIRLWVGKLGSRWGCNFLKVTYLVSGESRAQVCAYLCTLRRCFRDLKERNPGTLKSRTSERMSPGTSRDSVSWRRELRESREMDS